MKSAATRIKPQRTYLDSYRHSSIYAPCCLADESRQGA